MSVKGLQVKTISRMAIAFAALSMCYVNSHAAAPEFSLQVLHEFEVGHPRGVIRGGDGAFYGVTLSGGLNGQGSVFRITSNGDLTSIFSFDGTNGREPSSPLLQGRHGNFYGVTQFGNPPGAGTLFQITPAGQLKTLILFNGTNGYHPYGRLTEASDGNIYGTTIHSTIPNKHSGTVFQLTATGELNTLFAFDADNDGAQPLGWLTEGADGLLYGATSLSRQNIFKISSSGLMTPLVYLSGTNGFGFTYLIRSRDGNFYGTTGQGGAFGKGTFFKISAEGVFTNLASFSSETGSLPNAIIEGSDGNFYGTTRYTTGVGTGLRGFGTVFRASPAGELATLAMFDGKNGRMPLDDLAEGSDGNFYGTASSGGKNDAGTFLRVVRTPRLSIAQSDLKVTLTWNSFIGAVYRVEFKQALSDNTWISVADALPANGGMTSFEINRTGATHGYYRIALK